MTHQLDAFRALQDGVQTQLANFLRGSFRFDDPDLQQTIHSHIADSKLVAGPVVEGNFPFEEATTGPRTTRELAAGQHMHPDLPGILERAAGDARWPTDRPLYKHQVDAFLAFRQGQSIAVSSGTGSGKTEAFLFPALDALLRDPDLGRPGVRVLVVYPLNALVNNQMDRIRAILGNHPKIRFALYTSRLPEKPPKAKSRFPAEVTNRRDLRARPPHILITNFSMLEYALVRPADATLFDPALAKPRVVVLDEAHVYAGSMAAEIALLLRRAYLRWGLEAPPQGAVTSATMKQGIDDGPARLRSFAAGLLSRPEREVDVLEGHRTKPLPVTSLVTQPLPAASSAAALDLDFPTLAPADDGGTRFDDTAEFAARGAITAQALSLAFAPTPGEPAAAALYRALSPLSWVQNLRDKLYEQPMELASVARELWPSPPGAAELQGAFRILQALSLARLTPATVPLLPVRLHALVRGPNGIWICVNPACPGAVLPGKLGAVYADATDTCSCKSPTLEVRVCESCGQAVLTGEMGTDGDGFTRLVPSRGVHCDLFVPPSWWRGKKPPPEHSIRRYDPTGGDDPNGAITLHRFDGGIMVGPGRLLLDVACPRCDTRRSDRSTLRRLEAGPDATLQVVVDSLLEFLPEHAEHRSQWRRGGGRRLLVFADNRQVAATLAAKQESSHDQFIGRRLVLEGLRSAAQEMGVAGVHSGKLDALQAEYDAAVDRDDLPAAKAAKKQIGEVKAALGSPPVLHPRLVATVGRDERIKEISLFSLLMTDGRTEGVTDHADALATHLVRRELFRRPSHIGNLEANGLVGVVYPDASFPLPPNAGVRRVLGPVWGELMGVLLDTARIQSCVGAPLPDVGLSELLPVWQKGSWLVKGTGPVGFGNLAFISKDAESARPHYLTRVLAALGAPATVTPQVVLEDAWNCLVAATEAGAKFLELTEGRLRVVFGRLAFADTRPETVLHRCGVCRAVWARQVSQVCPARGCLGILTQLRGQELDHDDRIVAAGAEKPLMRVLGLATQEHTAQIAVEGLERAEQRFRHGELNALICSTTMELGIDIGGLSSVLLSNVPPGPSNYLQRAGRAGRRSEGTSLVLTYARPRPFDQSRFDEPMRPFQEKIVPPRVLFESRKIVARHANALLLSTFFRTYQATEADGRNPMSSLRSLGAFLDDPLSSLVGASAAALAQLVPGLANPTLADAYAAWLDTAADQPPIQQSLERLLRGTVMEGEKTTMVCGRSRERIESLVEEVRASLNYLREQVQAATALPELAQDDALIKALGFQEQDLLTEPLLRYLAESQYLPRYGFPVQVVDLDERYGDVKNDAQGEDSERELRLQRDIAIALAEYAPGAEVVANKRVHISQGLRRHWTGGDAPGVLGTRYVGACGECGNTQFGRNEGDIDPTCPVCSAEGAVRVRPVIHPKDGFAVKWGERPEPWVSASRVRRRPVTEATYAPRQENVGQVSDLVRLAHDEEGQIVIRSLGLEPDSEPEDEAATSEEQRGRTALGYAICYACGRSEPERWDKQSDGTAADLPPDLKGHKRLRGLRVCEPAGYWRYFALGAAVRTETLRVEMQAPVSFPIGPDGKALATTWMVALRLAAGEVLRVDSREVGGVLHPRNGSGGAAYDVVLYDTVAGGVGHCRALSDRWDELVEAALDRLKCKNPTCQSGCHKCLLAFETQRYQRDFARSQLHALLEPHRAALKGTMMVDGLAAAPALRGLADVEVLFQRYPAAEVILLADSAAPDSMDGILGMAVRHADGGGRLRIGLVTLPNPGADETRFLARRLQLAIGLGNTSVVRVSPKDLESLGWRVAVRSQDRVSAFHGPPSAMVGPGFGIDWTRGVPLARTRDTVAAKGALAKIEALLKETPVTVSALEPPPPPPSVVFREIGAGLSGSQAQFQAWLKSPDGAPLYNRPVNALELQDPYLASHFQLVLLSELLKLFELAPGASVRVKTYPPEPKPGHVTVDDQVDRVRLLTGDPGWKPLALPPYYESDKRIHARILRGTRVDGTRFEVLFERGIDIFAKKGPMRITRPTVVVVRDPLP